MTTAETDIQLLLDGSPLVETSAFAKRTAKWIDPETGHFIAMVAHGSASRTVPTGVMPDSGARNSRPTSPIQ
ncbi:MAG: hypothetical protein ACXADD_18585 [Candidatus Thorarchaeota archaeon]